MERKKSTQKNNYKLFREGGSHICTGPFIGLSDVLGVLCRTPREYPRGRRWPTGAWVFRNWALLRHWQYHCIQLLWLWLQASPPPPSPHFSSLRCLLVVIALHCRRLPTGVQRILNANIKLECFAACPSLLCALPRLPLLCFALICFAFALLVWLLITELSLSLSPLPTNTKIGRARPLTATRNAKSVLLLLLLLLSVCLCVHTPQL
jgi:hypothetical protein